MRRASLLGGAILLAAMAASAAQAQAETSRAGCDRACLTRAMDGVLAAFVAHDRSKAHLAAGVRYTEDGVELPIGEGLWGTATGLGRYRHDFADPETGNAAAFTIVDEGGPRSILSLRIKVDRGAVSEIETIVSRSGATGGMGSAGVEALEKVGAPEAIWTEPVPPAERMSRADLQWIANMYFAGLEKNDGKGVYPFADDCVRLEGGIPTTSRTEDLPLPGGGGYGQELMRLGCKAQFEQGFYKFLDRIRDRRFVLIDQERGTVFSFVFFDHSGTVREVTLRNGRTVKSGISQPFTWELAEAFKITNGQIRRIEAAMKQAPYGMASNWPRH